MRYVLLVLFSFASLTQCARTAFADAPATTNLTVGVYLATLCRDMNAATKAKDYVVESQISYLIESEDVENAYEFCDSLVPKQTKKME